MSYYPVQEPTPVEIGQLREYLSTDGSTRYFCSTCGCHIFRWTGDSGWEVTTGVMKGPVDQGLNSQQEASWEEHIGVADTKDGGLAKWLPDIPKSPAQQPQHGDSSALASSGRGHGESLRARCDCGSISFHVTRPDEDSRRPHSDYPDLMIPYCEEENKDLICNPRDGKWWLRDNKYLAGTCACRSCRLSSGFEIQTWAFIPRANIFNHFKDGTGEELVPLDFVQPPWTILQAYQSSHGVYRNFCGRCGATVFWHNDDRSDLIDVSVGLFCAPEGARATEWLDWWKSRVSFEEETGRGRWGNEGRRAIVFTGRLRKGLIESAGDE